MEPPTSQPNAGNVSSANSVFNSISPTVKAEIDAMAKAFLAYANLQYEQRGKLSKTEMDDLFRQQMSASGGATTDMVEKVIATTNALTNLEPSPSPESPSGGRMAVMAPNDEAFANFDMLPSGAKEVMDYLAADMGEFEAESGNVNPDNTMFRSRISYALEDVARGASYVGGISDADRATVVEAIYGTQQLLPFIHQFTINNYASFANGTAEYLPPEARSGWCWRCFWRAALRVVVAVAVTAVIVAIPVAAVAVAKGLVLTGKVSVLSKVGAALTAGVKVGSLKVSSALSTGLAAGVKNAAKNWDKGWQGISEFTFGIKFKPI